MTWNPEQYTQGNYFQNRINDVFRHRLNTALYGNILDVGCGDGQYSRIIASTMTHGHLLGIDQSEEMIQHAQKHWASDQLSFEIHSIETFQTQMRFDVVLSFWCLHWTSIHSSFHTIFNVLKTTGRLFAILSSFSENSILKTWKTLAQQGRYSDLIPRYIQLPHQTNPYFFRVLNALNRLPFKHVKMNMETVYVHFPNIEHFKNLLRTMPFMNTFPAEKTEELIDAMLEVFQIDCQRQYGNALYYETRPIFLEAMK